MCYLGETASRDYIASTCILLVQMIIVYVYCDVVNCVRDNAAINWWAMICASHKFVGILDKLHKFDTIKHVWC